MIAHVSIPAKNPKEIALLLARIIDGEVFNFPVVPGAWITIAKDNSGLAVEVYPEGMAHHPGKGGVDPALQPNGPQAMPWEDQIFPEAGQKALSSHHIALGTKKSEEEILALGKAAGFRTLTCDRAGVFKVIELWIDNQYLIEVLTEKELKRYASFMNPKVASEMFGAPVSYASSGV